MFSEWKLTGIMYKDEERVRRMRTAFRYYGKVHREYLWLHVIYFCVLLVTSVFWFILPLYIFYYGQYAPTMPLQIFLMGVLFMIPSITVTLPSWFISFQAACKWVKQYPGENKWKWFLRFQAMAFCVVYSFTIVIFFMIFFIDFVL